MRKFFRVLGKTAWSMLKIASISIGAVAVFLLGAGVLYYGLGLIWDVNKYWVPFIMIGLIGLIWIIDTFRDEWRDDG